MTPTRRSERWPPRQRWAGQRDEYQMMHLAALQRRRVDELSGRAVTVYREALSVALHGVKIMGDELLRIQLTMIQGADDVGPSARHIFSAADVLALARALEKYTRIARDALGAELSSLPAAEAEVSRREVQPDEDAPAPWNADNRLEEFVRLLHYHGVIVDEDP